MKTYMNRVAIAALATGIATTAVAEEWNVSLWGSPRAF